MSIPKNLIFEIVTPEKLLLREAILSVTVPTESGEVTILPGHVPLVSVLKSGVLEIVKEDLSKYILSVSSGFLEVLESKVVVLADTAELAAELDEARIKEAKAKAEALKRDINNREDVSFAEAAAMLEKELARNKAINKYRNIK